MRPAPTRHCRPFCKSLPLDSMPRALRYHDLKDVHQSTTSHTIYCVTTALLRRLPQEIHLPTSQEKPADEMKTKIFRYDITCLLGYIFLFENI